MDTAQELAQLYARDLTRLLQELDAFPDETSLWTCLPGIRNSAGNLMLHLEGNLREYIGRLLGHVAYVRQRDLEFSTGNVAKEELTRRLGEVRELVPQVLSSLSPEALDAIYPEVVLERSLTTRQYLIHTHGHLTYHLGQIDYLRRIVTGSGAITLAGL